MRWTLAGVLLAVLGFLLGWWVLDASREPRTTLAQAGVDAAGFDEELGEALASLPEPFAVASDTRADPPATQDAHGPRVPGKAAEPNDWSAFPRTTRDFVSWVLGGASTMRAERLFRHVELNPSDTVLGRVARARIHRVVREYRPAIQRLHKLWLDRTAREMAALVATGGAHAMPAPQPSSGPPSHLRARLPKSPTPAEGAGPHPSRAWSFPPESMKPGNVSILGLGESPSGSWASMKDMPASREAHNASQIVHEAFGKDLVAAFHAYGCLDTEQARALFAKLHSEQFFVIR